MAFCGECLSRDVRIVELVDGRCPKCEADYTNYNHEIISPSEETFERQPLPHKIKGHKIRMR